MTAAMYSHLQTDLTNRPEESSRLAVGSGPVLYMYVHLAKTGGQTLLNHLFQHMDFNEDFVHLGHVGEEARRKLGLTHFARKAIRDRQRARIIGGHWVECDTHRLVPGATPRYITVLRDPAERAVSLYNFHMKRRAAIGGTPMSFDDWCAQNRERLCLSDRIVRNFVGIDPRLFSRRERVEFASEALRSFWLVTVLERLDNDVLPVLEDLGVPAAMERQNVSGVDFPRILSLSPDLRARIYDDLPLEKAFFDFWRKRSPHRGPGGDVLTKRARSAREAHPWRGPS